MTDPKEPAAPPVETALAPLPEGEEAPPPGTRAAAVVRWVLVGLMALAAGSAWIVHVAGGGFAAPAASRALYRCPMHPTVVAERKGECPICGMDLVPAAAAPVAAAVAEGGPSQGRFTCPMHPAFVTDDPKARCPDCGMKLVPREADAGAAGGAAGVPGLAPVELTAERIQLGGIRTAVVTREPLAATVRTAGFVAASEAGLVSVTLRFPGWIEALPAGEVGRLVAKGEVLARVRSPDAVAAQQQFLGTVRWLEPAPGAPSAGAPAGGSSAAGSTTPDYDAAREARQRMEALGFAPEDLDALVASGKPSEILSVRAPVRGHVARRSALRGAWVQPGTELFQVADLSTVWVLAEVEEGEIGRVRAGQRATLEVRAWPGERFEGRVTVVYPALAAGSRTLQARVELRNPSLRLRPGMFGDVTLHLGAAAATVVPAEAVVDTGDAQYVFVSRGGGRFEPRRVRAGPAADGRVAVLDGVAEGERVVVAAGFLLDSESRLRAAIEGPGPR